MFLVACPLSAATLKGLVRAKELGGPPMANVAVSALGANQDVTKAGGQFALDFPNRKAGDTVNLSVKLPGYVVVNDIQLEVRLPADPDANPLIILLSKPGVRDEMARRFYRIKSIDAVEANYKTRQRESDPDNSEQLAVLARQRDQALAAAAKAAEELAKTRLGDSSGLYREAMHYFLDGKVERALQVLDDVKLRTAVQAANERKAAADSAIRQATNAYLLKAQLLTSQFRFDEAESAYRTAIETSPQDFNARFAFAWFSQELNHFLVAREAYAQAEVIARKGERRGDLAAVSNNLGILDSAENRMKEARKHYEDALTILRDLVSTNPDAYRPELARTLIMLGTLDNTEGRMVDARKHHEEGLAIWRDLARKNPDAYTPDFASALANLGNLYSDENLTEEAVKAYEQAVTFEGELARKNPDAYRPGLASMLATLGDLYRNANRMVDARKALDAALKIHRDLVSKNPDAYRPYLARTLTNLGALDGVENRMVDARKALEEARAIQRDLVLKNPDACLPDLAVTLTNLGTLDNTEGHMVDARKDYEEAIAIYLKFVGRSPGRYLPRAFGVKRLLDGLK